MIQTKPILIEEGQYWAFTIDLGNNSLRSPKNARPKRSDELPWLKFSVMECCMSGSNET